MIYGGEKMKNIISAASAALLLLFSFVNSTVYGATTVSYYLDQTNLNPLLPDGTNYLQVTISDNQAGQLDFIVETVAGAFLEGQNFGIQAFGFNILPPTNSLTPDDFLVPDSWSIQIAPPQNTMDGFGGFDILVSDGGNSRQNPSLQFSVLGLSLSDIVPIELSSGTAAQGNVAFAAHVADFATSDTGITSGFFGGSTVVPVPAALWLFGSGLLGLIGIARRKNAA